MFGSDWWRMSHLFVVVFLSDFSTYVVNPAINDVFVDAVCAGKDECSLALYLTGFQQAITGLGATIMMPVIGNLSDVYGRKKMLLIPLVLAVIPTAILSCKRTTDFFYAFYAFKCLTGMITGGGVICISLAYLADNVSERTRISAFGVLSGVTSVANVIGTLSARFLSTSDIFLVSTAASAVAVVYTALLVKEESHNDDSNSLEQPILNSIKPQSHEEVNCESSSHSNFMTGIPSPKHIIYLLKSSTTLSLLASVTFFNSLAETAISAFLQYYLKARFHFNKDQFSEILLITYAGVTVTSIFFLPAVGRFIGEETLLMVGLFGGFLHMLIDSIAWSPWVPYASASLGMVFALASPNIKSLVSKQIGSNEQGIAQGCIMGITSLTFIASPIIFTPLSAIFFADDAPANLTGLSIFCIALAYLIGFILSIFIKIIPRAAKAGSPQVEEGM
ncbi:uncharacterized protein LOC127251605 [Andrographis paniculata]|uniref:uncharacterized protein LOC127251605 n=1 Tax=Andrographis paniculata TaxID=175694 RepID=UPI0021E7AAED|nr:uncharacterized protein LOC127251605 [Andrographis paniculata]